MLFEHRLYGPEPLIQHALLCTATVHDIALKSSAKPLVVGEAARRRLC